MSPVEVSISYLVVGSTTQNEETKINPDSSSIYGFLIPLVTVIVIYVSTSSLIVAVIVPSSEFEAQV
jgi:hypothetical protein